MRTKLLVTEVGGGPDRIEEQIAERVERCRQEEGAAFNVDIVGFQVVTTPDPNKRSGQRVAAFILVRVTP